MSYRLVMPGLRLPTDLEPSLRLALYPGVLVCTDEGEDGGHPLALRYPAFSNPRDSRWQSWSWVRCWQLRRTPGLQRGLSPPVPPNVGHDVVAAMTGR